MEADHSVFGHARALTCAEAVRRGDEASRAFSVSLLRARLLTGARQERAIPGKLVNAADFVDARTIAYVLHVVLELKWA